MTMPDREKVVKAFEICDNNEDGIVCKNCPYKEDKWNGAWEDETGKTCFQTLHADALALLKEQEAVEPSFKQDEKGIFVWCCGSCGAYMYHIYDGIDKAKEYAKFCRQCGKPVLWEGR